MSDCVTGFQFWLDRLKDPSVSLAPVSSCINAPGAFGFEEIVRVGTVVEVAHEITRRKRRNVAYWLAIIVRVEGYFVQLKMLGDEEQAPEYFWCNSAYTREPPLNELDQRIHPIGFAISNDLPFEPPTRLDLERDWFNYLYDELVTRNTLPLDYHEKLREDNQCSFRPGQMMEATSMTQSSAKIPVVVVGSSGRRVQLRPVNGMGPVLHFHDCSSMVQVCGWSVLHGRKILASDEYKEWSAKNITKLSGPLREDEASIFDFKPLLLSRDVEEALEKYPYKRGSEVLVIDFLSTGLRVGRVRKVLRNNYLLLDIVRDSDEEDKDPICLHAASDRLLSPNFAEIWGLEELVRPENYRCENSPELPPELFRRGIPRHRFRAGQLFEFAGVCATNQIYPVSVLRVCGHVLHVRFVGHPPSENQLVPITSTDIMPAGWCHANQHPMMLPMMMMMNQHPMIRL